MPSLDRALCSGCTSGGIKFMQTETKIKYIVYCRKSSEPDERQALSNESQRIEATKLIERLGIDSSQIIKPFVEESHSAKFGNTRPKFGKMLEMITNQEAQGIICWLPDRLSRNAIDTGMLVDLMDRNLLTQIITTSQTFSNTPNDKFLFSILCSQAKLENDNRAINAKRGMKTKAEMGWYPAPAPLGYINKVGETKGFKTISNDQERWKIVKLCLDSVLEGQKPFEVLRKAQNEWKLKGKNGGIIAESTFYKMLSNPFYCGIFEWSKGSGNWYVGKHEAMITEEEFKILQKIMGKRGTKLPKKKNTDYLYTGIMKCKKCGATMSGDHKDKILVKDKHITRYVYYRCSKKAKTCDCPQCQISEPELENLFVEILESIKPPQGFVDWANKWLKALHKEKSKLYQDIRGSQLKRKIEIQKQLDKLLQLYLGSGINIDDYKNKKEEYESESRILEAKIKDNDGDSEQHRKKIESALEFAQSACEKFKDDKTPPEEKRFLIQNLGANLFLNDKIIQIDLKKHLQTLRNKNKWKTQFFGWCEPKEYTDLLAKNDSLRPPKITWLPRVDSNHGPIA